MAGTGAEGALPVWVACSVLWILHFPAALAGLSTVVDSCM